VKQNNVQQVAKCLIGLRLSVARRAADMRVFHFGQMRERDGTTVGQYALHIQCSWRIDGPNGIFTGRGDLCEHISGRPMPDEWEPSIYDNVQDAQISDLLGGYDTKTHSHVNVSESLVVERVRASDMGDLDIDLSGGYRLVLFPDGSICEAWRLFEPGKDVPHFVIGGNESHFE
jgi:hypothetical protein